MKKPLSLFLCVILVLVMLPGIALPVKANTYGDWEYDIPSPGIATITKYNGSTAVLDIPTYLNGFKVTGIATYAFKYNNYISVVTVPDLVTSIGRYAFCGCTALSGITLPLGLTGISEGLFQECTNMTAATVPVSVTEIGSYAYYGCSSLKNISLPDTLTRIGSNVFYGCSSLETVYYAGSYEQWNRLSVGDGNGPLREATVCYSTGSISASGICGAAGDNITWTLDTSGLLTVSGQGRMKDYARISSSGQAPWHAFNASITSVIVESGVTNVGAAAFFELTALKNVTLPVGVTEIGESAFNNCTSLTGIVIPEGVTEVGDGAFYCCLDLTDIAFPASVTRIGTAAVRSCYRLKSCAIPAGVTVIGDMMFFSCTGLEWVTIPVSVTEIGSYAFSDCRKLTDVYYGGTAEQWAKIPVGEQNGSLTAEKLRWSSTEHLTISALTPNKTDASSGDTVTWTAAASGDRGPLRYRFYLYRDGSPVQKGDYGSGNTVSYTVTEPAVYTVRVYVKDSEGTSLNLTGGAVTVKPPAPKNLKVTSGLDGITVKWSGVSGAAKYRVIRTVDGVTTKIKVTGTSWTDNGVQAGKSYTYSVQAQTGGGVYSDASESKSLYYPLGIAVKVSGKKANVSWTLVTGATKYQVYRRSQAGGKYGSWELIYSGKGTAFTDTPGSGTWQYRVRAVVGTQKTGYSNRKKITIG